MRKGERSVVQVSTSPAELMPDVELLPQSPWITIVWNDPVNLMSYVTHVLMLIFGYSRERATVLMLQVHNEGKAVVSSGSREEMERDVERLHAYGLWATLEQVG
ncbi:MAG TPA: ATP-dependent Clp protease adapter ClpS [Candidatus Nanopelagicaceae bacterium]|nr:ATP-dependent Clp protease adapter ClpS [Candidatus Nanopelagicaceae bacterium]